MGHLILAINGASCSVSNDQKDDSEEFHHARWGLNCLQRCFITGSNHPIYTYKMEPNFNGADICELNDENFKSSTGFLECLLLGEWENKLQRGIFLYDVTACKTKILRGRFEFIAHLNEGRLSNEKTSKFRVNQVLQPFDESKFNFKNIKQEEILFHFEDVDCVVAINVTPLEYGHVILIPRIMERLPQRINPESFLLALRMAIEVGNPFFRMGYNSLGTCDTINHLHFQAYYCAAPFPIEEASQSEMTKLSSSGVQISKLRNYPVKGYVFNGGNTLDLSKVVSKACICLENKNIPFNVLISECGRRVFVLPRGYCGEWAVGEVWEICGHMVFNRKADYDDVSEDKMMDLLGKVSLTDKRFNEVFDLIIEFINAFEDQSLLHV